MVDKKSLAKQIAPQSDPILKRSYRGHKDVITAVSFNPNMKQVASASLDSIVTVWNFKNQTRPFKFVGHKGPVLDINFSPSGNTIASCSKDETIKLWNNSIEGHSSTIKAHNGAVRSVSFSSDGRLLVSSSDDKTVKVWNALEKKFLFSLSGHSNWVRTSQFSPDIRLVASGGDDKTVKIWDVENKSELHTFYDHSDTVNSVKFHPDGTCLASCSNDKKIKIWDIRSKRLLQHYDAHADNINQIAFHPAGNYLISASNDAKLKIWDLRQGRLAYTLYGHEGNCSAVNFSAGGDFFATGGSDNMVMVWKSNFPEVSGEYLEELVDTTRPVTASTRLKSTGVSGTGTGTRDLRTSGDIKAMTFSPNKSKNLSATGARKTNQVVFSTKDKAFHTLDENRDPDDITRTETISKTYASNLRATQDVEPTELPEELAGTLNKIVGQIDVITKTLQVLEMRLGVNEEQISHLSQLINSGGIKPPQEGQIGSRSVKVSSENVFSSHALHKTGAQGGAPDTDGSRVGFLAGNTYYMDY